MKIPTIEATIEVLRLFAGALLAAAALHGASSFAQTYTITTTHLDSDAFGNIILATDEQGNVLWRERYQPYGATRINQASKTNPANLANPQDRGANSIGFHGKEADAATGLSYFGARYYDPLAGRFMGTDAMRFDPANPHSFNRYAYGNGNPYKYKDPDGKMALPIFGVATILGVGGIITYYGKTPAEQRQMLSDLHRFRDRIFNQSSEGENKEATSGEKAGDGDKGKGGNKFPDRPLPRDKNGNPVPEPDATGPHTQLGRRGKYDQAREFDANGRPVKDIDFTDHGRPKDHPNPHQHSYQPTGGSPKRGAPEVLQQ